MRPIDPVELTMPSGGCTSTTYPPAGSPPNMYFPPCAVTCGDRVTVGHAVAGLIDVQQHGDAVDALLGRLDQPVVVGIQPHPVTQRMCLRVADVDAVVDEAAGGALDGERVLPDTGSTDESIVGLGTGAAAPTEASSTGPAPAAVRWNEPAPRRTTSGASICTVAPTFRSAMPASTPAPAAAVRIVREPEAAVLIGHHLMHRCRRRSA